MNTSQAERITRCLFPLIHSAQRASECLSDISRQYGNTVDRADAVQRLRDMLGWADRIREALNSGGDLGTPSQQEIFDAVKDGVEMNPRVDDRGNLRILARMTFEAEATLSASEMELSSVIVAANIKRTKEGLVQTIVRSLSDEKLDKMVCNHKAKLKAKGE